VTVCILIASINPSEVRICGNAASRFLRNCSV